MFALLPLPHSSTRGFSLVEVTLALGIMAFCLVPLFGLLPVGINSNKNSVSQTRAASIATNVAADLRAPLVVSSGGGVGKTPRFKIEVPQKALPNGKSKELFFSEAGDISTDTLDANSQYRVLISPPAKPNNDPNPSLSSTVWLNILVTWPAASTDPKRSRHASMTAIAKN